jgi:hypothetical protein
VTVTRSAEEGELSRGSSDVLARGDGGGVGRRVERKYERVFIEETEGIERGFGDELGKSASRREVG